MNPRPVLSLAVCHKDIEQAKVWLRWVAFLSTLAGEDEGQRILILMVTRRAKLEFGHLFDLAKKTRYFVEPTICPDELEDGYPRSASHLFLRTLEFAEKTVPGRSVLWVEPDCLPLHPQWLREISDEYVACGHAFMSQRIQHAGRNSSHLMGNAVYPHDWRQRAPRLLTAHMAPDHPMFGTGKGQPFDVWACEETTADMFESNLFQQIFNCKPWSAENLNRLRPGAALFHRCKDATLVAELARTRFPAFAATLPRPTLTFQMIGHPSRLRTLGYPDMPWVATRGPAGWLSTCRPTDPLHEMVLRCLAGTKGISVVG